MQKLFLVLAFSVLLLSGTGLQLASGHGLVDQSTTGPGTGSLGLADTENYGQEFIPTVDNLVAVEIELIHRATTIAEPVTVRIRDGQGLSGTLLGTTQTHLGLPGVGNSAIVHFDFPAPVPLTPGNSFTFTLDLNFPRTVSIISIPHDGSTNSYPAGITITNFGLNPNLDFIFATLFEQQTQPVGGEIIPIETTSLILAGAQSFSWMIPVILSGIGIGLFVVSRKSE